MGKPEIDYMKIDEGIRDVVYALNQIPYVETEQSCEGHLNDDYDSRWPGVFPDEGHKFLEGGIIIFKVDEENSDAQEFLREVKEFEQEYSFAELSEHHCGEEDCSIGGSKVLCLGYRDLIHRETIIEDDSFKRTIKGMHQVETSAGRERVEDYQKVWSELLTIAKKHYK